ncbi:MAG: HAD family hydrolase [Verrucomicrobiales bacterium]
MDQLAYVRASMHPPAPIPADVPPKLTAMGGIKAVIFDIYGTLLVSAAGGGDRPDEATSQAMAKVVERLGPPLKAGDGAALAVAYRAVVRQHQDSRRAEGVDFPEIEIREVWETVLGEFVPTRLSSAAIESASIAFECAVNPVGPMPGARGAIEALRGTGFLLGVVSNAQFYTPVVIESCLGASFGELGFASDLMVFSYLERRSKPSVALFECLKSRAAERSVSADEMLYLGNDLEKDMFSAAAAGFRTGLFAGDQRSLRLGGRSYAEASEKADVVITDLEQLPGILELPS